MASSTVLSIADLTKLIQATYQHPLGVFLRPLFLLAFFGFLRISNLLPKCSAHWNAHFTLLRGDIVLGSDHAIIGLKWTKSRQSRARLSHV